MVSRLFNILLKLTTEKTWKAHVTGALSGESTGHRWTSLAKGPKNSKRFDVMAVTDDTIQATETIQNTHQNITVHTSTRALNHALLPAMSKSVYETSSKL